MRIGIAAKFGAMGILLGSVALASATFAVLRNEADVERTRRAESAWQSALTTETLARDIEHVVVVGSNALAAQTPAEVRSRLDALRATTEALAARRAELTAALHGTGEERARRIEARLRDFVAFQIDTIELGSTISPKAAAIQYYDDATTANRERLLREMNEVSTRLTDTARAENLQIEERRAETRRILVFGPPSFLLLALLLAAFGVESWIRRPLDRLRLAMVRMASGSLDVAVPFQRRRDEIGEMADALAAFREGLTENRRLQARDRDLAEIESTRRIDLERRAAAFESGVRDLLGEVSRSARHLGSVADTLDHATVDAESRSKEIRSASRAAAEDVQVVSFTTQALAESIEEIGVRADESARMTSAVSRDVAEAVRRIEALSEEASRVGRIVELIDAVAAQTNLLALNATIEAARAGEAGRGFAVVAAEVKKLADQTGRATAQIATQVTTIGSATKESAQAIEAILGNIGALEGIAGIISSAVEEHGAATDRIGAAVLGASHGTAAVDMGMAAVETVTTESARAAADVLASSRALVDVSGRLTREIETFLVEVRAA